MSMNYIEHMIGEFIIVRDRVNTKSNYMPLRIINTFNITINTNESVFSNKQREKQNMKSVR